MPWAARAEEKTAAVVVDRSGSVDVGDPRGDGRAALAFALALSARPGLKVVVFAPGVSPAVEGDAATLEGLGAALRTIVGPPAPGGADLRPLYEEAFERGSIVLAYTADDLDVIDMKGKAPEDALAKAREGDAHPDRKAVNGAARALLAARAAERAKGKLVALRTPLPEAARTTAYLEALSARVVELREPLEAARLLAKELAGLEAAPISGKFDEETAKVEAPAGSRIAILAEETIQTEEKRALPLDPAHRAWIVDAEGPLEVTGKKGTAFAALVAPRARLEFAASAHRLASGAIHVHVAPKDPKLPLAARAQGVDLDRAADGSLRGRLPATDAASIPLAVGPEGALPEPAPLAVERALLAVKAAEVPVAGARTKLVASAAGLPAELVPSSISVGLSNGKEKLAATLARAGDSFEGEAVLGDGTWKLETASAGELACELEPLSVRPAAVLAATLVVASKTSGGAAKLVVDLALDPASATGATPRVAPSKGAASLAGTFRDKGRFEVALTGVEPGPLEVGFTVPLERGAEARASLAVTLEAAPDWKKPAAAAVAALGLFWVGIVRLRRRALLRRFGNKQLRGLGSNGKMSYERYRLLDHREGRFAAVAPPGATAIHIEIAKDGRVRARPVEGSEVTGPSGKPAEELLLVHETCFLVTRGLYKRHFVYLEREPTADELGKRYLEGSPSYDGQETRDSDVFVLLDDKQNMVPPSQRLVPLDSAKLPKVSDVVAGGSSDDAVVLTTSSEERVLDDEKAILDPGSSDETGSDDLIEDD